MRGLHIVTCILLIVGGLNWLLFALAGNDIGGYLLGGMGTTASKVVYILVGLAAVIEIFAHKKGCKTCGNAGSSM